MGWPRPDQSHSPQVFSELTPAQRADLLHAVAKYRRDVIDRVRVGESKKCDEAGRQLIKASRYLLLKNQENVTGDQSERLDALLAANKNLSTVYILRDQLKELWRYRRQAWARRAAENWCTLAESSGLTTLRTFARNLRRHLEGIINHCRYARHTGRLEESTTRSK